MLIDIDHVAFSSKSLKSDSIVLKNLGYMMVFEKYNIVNLPIKKNLLSVFFKTHNIALYKRNNDFPIEIIEYQEINKQNGYIEPQISGLEKEELDLYKDFLVEKNWRLDYTDKKCSFHTIIVKTKDIEKSLGFWEIFGWRFSKRINPNRILLKYFSILKQTTFFMELRKNVEIADGYYLNDSGANSIAYITNSIKKEYNCLKRKGLFVTDIETLFLDNELSIFFVVGPAGELIEIIERK